MRNYTFIAGLFLFISCSNQPSGIITVSDDEIRTMIPADFFINSEYQVIFINDTAKLSYSQNQFLMKDQLRQKENGYCSVSDTLSNRLLRKFQVKKVKEDKYKIKFELIDLKSDEIPSIFGGNKNHKLISRPFSLNSYKENFLTEEETDYLKKSLFRAYK